METLYIISTFFYVKVIMRTNFIYKCASTTPDISSVNWKINPLMKPTVETRVMYALLSSRPAAIMASINNKDESNKYLQGV